MANIEFSAINAKIFPRNITGSPKEYPQSFWQSHNSIGTGNPRRREQKFQKRYNGGHPYQETARCAKSPEKV